MNPKNEISIEKLYRKLLPPSIGLSEAAQKLCEWDNHPRIDELRALYCDYFIGWLRTFTIYSPTFSFLEDPSIYSFCRVADKLPPAYFYYKAAAAFFRGKAALAQDIIMKGLDACPPTDEYLVTEEEISDYFVLFKNRFASIWSVLKNKFEEQNVSSDILCLCDLIQRCYSCSPEEKLNLLAKHLSEYPDSKFAKEYLGLEYYQAKMYRNSIACLETIRDPIIFDRRDLCFILADSFYFVKDFVSAEKQYKKCLREFPDEPGALNSLGYILLKRKKYVDALAIFQKCLAEGRDLPYSANNCVRALLLLGRGKEALELINSGKYRVDKGLTDRVIRAIKNDRPSSAYINDEIADNTALSSKRITSHQIVGEMQFHSEKMLEDELEAKINAGIPVFGKKLKMFKRSGEYGRQYVIPIGRLDLLCEDDDKNLYVIELKRDSGYDDVYEQTVRYMEWFEHNSRFKDVKVFGIICLNAPSSELIKKVRSNDRISLFEYSIRYTRIQ